MILKNIKRGKQTKVCFELYEGVWMIVLEDLEECNAENIYGVGVLSIIKK